MSSNENVKSQASGIIDTTSPSPPCATEEKAWLKKNWGNEFHFLLSYGIKIYNEEDREEGRAIVHAFMEEDDEDLVPEVRDSEQFNSELARSILNAGLITSSEKKPEMNSEEIRETC
jgi:hypothetical protein